MERIITKSFARLMGRGVHRGFITLDELHKSLGKNRQRRCAILKDNVQHDGMVMPWYWNPSVSVALAPGITAFVKGDHYNHGGLSIQECLTPELLLTKT